MASAKEIRTQIKAIQNTGKITKAMEMVAASKMRKAQQQVINSRSYAIGIRRIVTNLMQAHPEYHHPFITPRDEVKRAAVIVISTDKGLCGGLNTNAMKKACAVMKEVSVECDALAIGRRASMFMRRINAPVIASAENINDQPSIDEFIGVIQVAINHYMEGKIDEVHLIYNEFVNTMMQTPVSLRLLPCPMPEEDTHPGYWDYLYEPESNVVLEGLLKRYIESLVYHAVLENKACEHSARMVAMKAATDNSQSIVRDLSITYNKARQAAITQEIAEICSGAAAAS